MDELETMARALAEILGWQADIRYGHNPRVWERPGGEGCQLLLSEHRGRARIRGVFSEHMREAAYPDLECPSITAAFTTEPRLVAGRIRRDILPVYRGELERGASAVADARRRRSARADLARDIVSALPGACIEPSGRGATRTDVRYQKTSALPWSAVFSVRSDGGSADIEIRQAPASMVSAIARLIADGSEPSAD